MHALYGALHAQDLYGSYLERLLLDFFLVFVGLVFLFCLVFVFCLVFLFSLVFFGFFGFVLSSVVFGLLFSFVVVFCTGSCLLP